MCFQSNPQSGCIYKCMIGPIGKEDDVLQYMNLIIEIYLFSFNDDEWCDPRHNCKFKPVLAQEQKKIGTH